MEIPSNLPEIRNPWAHRQHSRHPHRPRRRPPVHDGRGNPPKAANPLQVNPDAPYPYTTETPESQGSSLIQILFGILILALGTLLAYHLRSIYRVGD